jgi:hypothetical protein
MMKKRSLILIAALLFPISSAVGASTPDEQWFLPAIGESGQELQGIVIQDTLDLMNSASNLMSNQDVSRSYTTNRLCKSANDEFCSKAVSAYFQAILQPCITSSSTNCIEGLQAISSSGSTIDGTLSRQFPKEGYTDFPEDLGRNLPAGSTPSIWKLPGVNHGGGGDEFLVTFSLNGASQNGAKNFEFNSYSAFLSPVNIIPGEYRRNEHLDTRNVDLATCAAKALACGTQFLGHSNAETKICAAIDEGYCASKQAFPAGFRFKLKVRLSQSPTGWFHGRLKAPNIEINKINPGVLISIEGEPVQVPVIGVKAKYATLESPLKSFYSSSENSGSWVYGEQGPNGRRNQIAMPRPDDERTFKEYSLWNDYIKDKASASPSVWTLRTLPIEQNTAECFKDTSKFVGIVTTNSMIYAGGPPVFSESTQSLDYKVGSPHLASNGDVFKGTYDLQVRSDVARCLYNFTDAPIQASISIINETGDANVASTVINEKNGWLRLAAYNFTFSNPVVKVKLTQEKAASSVIPAKKLAKEITITCSKGKKVQRIYGVKPKCPAGYKKK